MLALLLNRLPSLLRTLELLVAEEGVARCLSDAGVDILPSGCLGMVLPNGARPDLEFATEGLEA
jgi:hypothetical protein